MRNNKKGSSAIFLVMIMASIFTIVFCLVNGARSEYIKSRADGVISLSGDSVMSEFNNYVLREYGLFALDGRKSFLETNLKWYIDYSMDHVRGARVNNISANGSSYTLANYQLVREQIVEYMKYSGLKNTIKKLEGTKAPNNTMKEETLRNGEAIVSLATYDMPKVSLTIKANEIAAGLNSPAKILNGAGEKYIINKYIVGHFNNRASMVCEEHFFRNEVEYILGGELSDKQNEKRVEMGLESIRFPLNLQHIYSSPDKMKKLLVLAEILAPEAPGPVQLALAATWAYAESDNDVKCLKNGYKVPIFKTTDTWAIDLDSAIEGFKTGIFKPDIDKGYTYEQYLQFMLYFMDDDIKTGRIMDLIQINTRMNDDSKFVFEESCAGMNIEVVINNRKYRYAKEY